MTQPLLSILIPITPDRKTVVQPLLKKIGFELSDEQLHNDGEWVNKWEDEFSGVELIMHQDNRELTLGEKRERLYQMASGQFSWQIDSDDDIADNGLELVLEAIINNPAVPCITFKEKCIINGEYKSSIFSIRYNDWQDEFDCYNFVRTPFYKSVIRTDIAKSVPFERIRLGEDHAWSKAIRPWLTSEYFIDQEIYYYIHNSSPSHERYGFYHDK